jgi:hypothetical protein
MDDHDKRPDEYSVEMACDPASSLLYLAREAEGWGGEWQAESASQGRLLLPVLAGVRHGWVEGSLRVEPVAEDASRSRLTLRVDKSLYRVRRSTVTVLGIAALGALCFLLAPFIPRLWSLVPLGFMVSLGAWFFILSGLRNSGPEEFFEILGEMPTEEGQG